MASEIPSSYKKSVRAILLSKLGGVLVSQFAKDYKSLVQEQLPYKSLGFDNLEDFFTAMPDVVRLEYCKKDMAYRVFGIGDADTYMPSWIKKSQDPNVLSPKSRRKVHRFKSEKKQASGSVDDNDDDGPQIDENNRYSVMYPRKKTPNFSVQDVKLKFQDTGDIVTVHIIERWIFIRYWKREEAIRAYDMFHAELGVKFPSSNKGRSGNMNQSNNNSTSAKNGDVSSSCGGSFGTSIGASFAGEDTESTSFGGAILGSKGTIPENKKRNDSFRNIAEVSGMNEYQVYVGNLANDIKESDLDEIVGGRTVTRVCLKRSKDGIKVVGFISFTSAKDAEDVIASWDSKTFHGRNLLVRPGKQSQDNSRADDSNSSINWKSSNSNNNESLSQLSISTNNHTDGQNGRSKTVSPRQVHCTNGTNITIKQTSNISCLPTQVLIKNPVLSKTGLSPNLQQKSSCSDMPPLEPLNTCNDIMPPLQPMNSKIQITKTSKPQVRSPSEASMSKKPSPNQKIQPLQSMPPLEPMMPPLESIMPPLEPIMPPLEPMMPPLEPIMSPLVPAIPVLQPMRQPASSILPAPPVAQESDVEEYEDDCPTAVFVGNFPAGTTDKELYALFKRYGVFKVEMVNNSPRQDKGWYSTKAFVTVQSLSNAVEAILDLDQTDYFDRNIKVAAPHNDKKLHDIVENKIQEYMSDSDSNSSPPSKSSSRDVSRNLSRSTNGSNISYFSSYTDVTDLESEDAAALLETYGYIKSKVQASKISQPLRQGETVTLSVTAWLIEQYYFVQNGSDMEALRDLQAITIKMQNKEYHLGRTKGLGRCVALYKKDWYRGWILREDRNNHLVKVFYIDYGNICIIPSKDTSIVSSWVWDLAPQARPVRIEVGSKGPYEKELVDKVITATVTSVKTVDKCPVYDVLLNSILS